MKLITTLLIYLSGALAVAFGAPEKASLSKEKALARLMQQCSGSEVVVFANVSEGGSRLTITCSEIWKAKLGAPRIGEVIEIDARQQLDNRQSQAVVFFPEFPAGKGWYNALSFIDGRLGICPDLTVEDVRRAIASMASKKLPVIGGAERG